MPLRPHSGWIVALALALGPGGSTALGRQPNIVVLLADDLGYGELGCQGNRQIPTPHIDSLALDGVRFTQGYVTAPNCSPSRAGLLTGRIPTRFGYEFNPIGPRNADPTVGLPASETTLATLLRDVGYSTGLLGKWHLGGTAAYNPMRRGFDTFFGFLHEGHYYVPPPWEGVTTMLRRKALPGGGRGRWSGDGLVYSTHMGHNEPDYDADNPILRGGQPLAEPDYLTDALTREALGFIDRHRDRPFFLCVAYNAVHSPLQGADAYMDRFKSIPDIHRRIFAAMLANLDESVGAILEGLGRAGLGRETLVVFLSDNGGPTRELTSSNAPLRGEKGDLYEGGIRVPFLVRWPGRIPAGRTFEPPVSSMDLFATAAKAAGVDLPPNLDGVDLIPFLAGEKADRPHKTLFWRQGNKRALRVDNWKLVAPRPRGGPPAWELYDLGGDPSEQHDLASDRPEVVRELIEAWRRLDAEMRPPLF